MIHSIIFVWFLKIIDITVKWKTCTIHAVDDSLDGAKYCSLPCNVNIDNVLFIKNTFCHGTLIQNSKN